MANLLSPEYKQILDLLRRSGSSQMKDMLTKELAPVYERVGLRSPQVAAVSTKANTDLTNYLLGKESELLGSSVARNQQLEDTASDKAMTYEQWNREAGMQTRDIYAQKENLMQGREWQLEDEARNREYELEDRKYGEQLQRKNIWKTLLSTGANMMGGGIMSLFNKDIPFSTGLTAGASGVGEINSFNSMLQSFLKGNSGNNSNSIDIQSLISGNKTMPDMTKLISGWGESRIPDYLRKR